MRSSVTGVAAGRTFVAAEGAAVRGQWRWGSRQSARPRLDIDDALLNDRRGRIDDAERRAIPVRYRATQ